MITTLVNWKQVEKYLLGARRQYNARWPPQRLPPEGVDNLLKENSWTKELPARLVDAEIHKRLELPMHRQLTPYSVDATLQYLFNHLRCGIYVMLRQNRVAMFVPFVNEAYRNNWGDRLRVEDELDNAA